MKSLQNSLIGVCLVFAMTLNAQNPLNNENLSDDKAAQKITDLFYALNGDTTKPHKKINHTKGFCASGEFVPNKKETKDFAIPLLHQKSQKNGVDSVEAKIRFSLGGDEQNDKTKSRAMAIKMQSKEGSPNSDFWEIAMTNSRINFAKNAGEFIEFMQINVEQKQGKITAEEAAKKRQAVQSFVNFAREIGTLGVSPSFANNAYHSVHTFFFKKSSGELVPARFSFVPKSGIKYLNSKELEEVSQDFLESNFKKQLENGGITFSLVLELAKEGDSLSDTASLWADINDNGEKIKREKITLGELKINAFSGYECNGEVFMPSVLPEGIEPPKDDMFDVRNMVYANTFSKRQ
ncbi:catalase [Helicobacter sp. T3_23-1059]